MASLEYDKRRALVSPTRLSQFFGARRLAIVGASETSSWARNMMQSLEYAGGVKDLVFVHPKYSELFGHKTRSSLRELEESVDLAFIMVGPNRVDEILEDAAAAGIHNAVVLAAGYSESGEEGKARQAKTAELAKRLDITILGPNTIGYINATAGVAPWAVATARPPLRGPVSAVFESGSMARATHEFAQAHGIGSSLWVSVGNSAVLTSIDVLEYLIEDEATKSIALFLETVSEPNRLLELGHRALAAGKPIAVFKAGRSEAGKRSAMAHTGAVATDDAVVDALFKQAGIVRTESIEELMSTVGLFAYLPKLPSGRRMGVVTSSGGGCNIIADAASSNGLELPEWKSHIKDELAKHLPPFGSILNPLDTTGFGHARARPRATKAEDDLMEIAVKDDGIDFMFNMMTPLPSVRPDDPTFIESRIEIIGGIVRDAPVPVVLCSNTCLDLADYPRGLLAEAGLYLLPGAQLALAAVGNMMRWVDRAASILATTDAPPTPIESVLATNVVGSWAETEGRELLQSFGAPVVDAILATTADEAAQAAADFGVPVAMKVCSREIPHKSDVGGVVLGVDAVAAAEVFQQIISSAVAHAPSAVIRGVLVSPMRKPALELLVGVHRDPVFGPVLAVGLGGIWVETLKDISLRVLPVGPTAVREMLLELRAAPVLTGGRGRTAVDLDRLSEAVVAISQAALALGDRLETLEVNPLRVDGAEIEALDALVVTRSLECAG